MKHIALFLTFALISYAAFAQDATAIRKKHFNLEDGLAIDGYDPVSYLTQNKAIKGKKEFALVHQGATYYFSSLQNKEEFRRNPVKYEPEYGGWCAYAMGSKGDKVSIDPKTFKVVNGKLYLFYNRFFNNTLTDWNKDEDGLRKKADVNWGKTYR